ncbi:MAG: PRC-barrel domain-containing protein [Pseudorhodoplanes sp.]
MITTALSGALIGAASAQSNMDAPSANAPSANAPMANAPIAGNAKFINAQSTDQWLTSNFIGVDVIGPDNQKIGDIVDVLFEKNGNVVGYVVGVGGFLGIGAKNVALAPSSFQAVPASEGTTGSAASTAPEDVKLKLNMTKDQLQQAAAFESKRDQESKARAAAQPGQGGMNRPVDRPATSPR